MCCICVPTHLHQNHLGCSFQRQISGHHPSPIELSSLRVGAWWHVKVTWALGVLNVQESLGATGQGRYSQWAFQPWRSASLKCGDDKSISLCSADFPGRKVCYPRRIWHSLELCGISERITSLTYTTVWRNGLLAWADVLFDNQKGEKNNSTPLSSGQNADLELTPSAFSGRRPQLMRNFVLVETSPGNWVTPSKLTQLPSAPRAAEGEGKGVWMCSCGFCDVCVVTVCESGCGRVGVGEGVWCLHVGA